MTSSDLKGFTTSTIFEEHPATQVQDNLQRHKCSTLCQNNSLKMCKDFPAYFIINDVELHKSKKTKKSQEILRDYRNFLSSISEKGHNYLALYKIAVKDLLTELNCNYNEYLYAVSTTIAQGKQIFFKREIKDAYVIPHNVEATVYLNATTHVLLCNSLVIALYVSKYTSKRVFYFRNEPAITLPNASEPGHRTMHRPFTNHAPNHK